MHIKNTILVKIFYSLNIMYTFKFNNQHLQKLFSKDLFSYHFINIIKKIRSQCGLNQGVDQPSPSFHRHIRHQHCTDCTLCQAYVTTLYLVLLHKAFLIHLKYSFLVAELIYKLISLNIISIVGNTSKLRVFMVQLLNENDYVHTTKRTL